MKDTYYRIARFDGAVELLPQSIRGAARFLDERDKEQAEELRLRSGHIPTVLLPSGEKELGGGAVTQKELHGVLEIASGASVHTVRECIRNGFVTAKGGYRIGVCGSAILREGAITGFRDISSVAIRIVKEIRGAADSVMDQLTGSDGSIAATLIVSPPGAGKTTLLRDIIRQLSERGVRVAVADERGELAGMLGGVPQMDIGARCDVLDGCPKAEAVLMLLRAMNPQIIAVDEITDPRDAAALSSAVHCGVSLLATAHGESIADLRQKPLYRDALQAGLFRKIILIRRQARGRAYQVMDVEAEICTGS